MEEGGTNKPGGRHPATWQEGEEKKKKKATTLRLLSCWEPLYLAWQVTVDSIFTLAISLLGGERVYLLQEGK